MSRSHIRQLHRLMCSAPTALTVLLKDPVTQLRDKQTLVVACLECVTGDRSTMNICTYLLGSSLRILSLPMASSVKGWKRFGRSVNTFQTCLAFGIIEESFVFDLNIISEAHRLTPEGLSLLFFGEYSVKLRYVIFWECSSKKLQEYKKHKKCVSYKRREWKT